MTEHPVKLPVGQQLPLKSYLQKYCSFSGSLWKRVKHSGTLTVNGAIVHPVQAAVQDGDRIAYDVRRRADIIPEEMPLSICYEDEDLLVLNKSAGLLVHPTTAQASGTLANGVLAYYESCGETADFHPVHRLDRNTSGLLLIAKRPEIHHLLAARGKEHFHRSYLALTHKSPNPPTGRIDAPISRALPSIILRKISSDGKEAQTDYRTLATDGEISLVELKLATGRTHQIRVHMASVGCPLLGDDLYGGSRKQIARQALHAHKLELLHPRKGTALSLCAPLPEDFKALLEARNFSQDPVLSSKFML